MADFVGDDALERWPLRPYAEVRPLLRTGDLLFGSNNGFVSRLTRRGTGSPWTHAGIIVVWERLGRVLVLESVTTHGVRFAPLSTYMGGPGLKPYDGAVMLARHSAAESQDFLTPLVGHGLDQLTRAYDTTEAVSIVVREWFRVTRHERNRAYICSELVEECFRKAGYNFTWNHRGYVTPADLWRDPAVAPLARIL